MTSRTRKLTIGVVVVIVVALVLILIGAREKPRIGMKFLSRVRRVGSPPLLEAASTIACSVLF